MNNPLNKAKEAVVNLIKKLYINLRTAKISKKIASLTIAGALVLSLASCEELPEPTPGTNPGGDPPTHEEQPTPSNPKYEGYSKLLQNIMANKYYDDIVDQIFIDNMSIVNSGEVEPHPYAFLEEEGFDVEAIKAGNDLAYTMSYVLEEEPNNLYMYTRVLNNDHYVNYLLKYELTDEEMDDYNMLHDDDGYAHFYLQSIFMNNEIAKTRKPVIVGKTKISVEAFKELTENLQYASSAVDAEYCDFILIGTNDQNDTFTIVLIPRPYEKKYMVFDGKINTASFQSSFDLAMKNEIFTGPTYKNAFGTLSALKQTAILYFSQEADLLFMKAHSLDTKPTN